ncbi:MAG TPA: GNAT family N-acetyltransferase [Bradyrhizobium sp.]|nr:GNAT family N-acetyltransferase [Bradyrhizobium sp.]
MPDARTARADDLASLLALFRVSEVSAVVEPMEQVERIWAKMLSRDGLTVFVSEDEAKIVSTCMLITAPNLLRSGRQHAFLENVVTHPDFRGRGFGARWCTPRSPPPGSRIVITCSCKAAAPIRACIVSTKAAGSSRGYGRPMRRSGLLCDASSIVILQRQNELRTL